MEISSFEALKHPVDSQVENHSTRVAMKRDRNRFGLLLKGFIEKEMNQYFCSDAKLQFSNPSFELNFNRNFHQKKTSYRTSARISTKRFPADSQCYSQRDSETNFRIPVSRPGTSPVHVSLAAGRPGHGDSFLISNFESLSAEVANFEPAKVCGFADCKLPSTELSQGTSRSFE